MEAQIKKVLVLSGGSLKGAFQVGAVKAVFESGFHPNAIFGISVGSLNGLFIINNAGSQNVVFEDINWDTISESLLNFWTQNIKQTSSIINKKKLHNILTDLLLKKFNGLIDTSPLHNLVLKEVSMENIYNSPISLKVGVANLSDGSIVYADPLYANFIDYVLASTAIPLLMPVVNIGKNTNKAFLDGGIRDVAPLKKAFESGAEEIICIACQSKIMHGATFNYGNVINTADRILDILFNEGINNDIDWAETINHFLPTDGLPLTDGPYKGYKKIKLTIIRPPVPINIDMINFNSDDIKNLINNGYRLASEVLKNA
jgi:NTE family protein